MAVSIETMKKLAGHTDDLSPLITDALPESIKAALVEAQADELKSAAKQAAGEIIKLMKSANVAIEAHVTSIRDARKQIDRSKDRIEKIARARDYALETNNWFPLIMLTESMSGSQLYSLKEDGVALEVPDNWVSKTAAPAARKVASPKK